VSFKLEYEGQWDLRCYGRTRHDCDKSCRYSAIPRARKWTVSAVLGGQSNLGQS
jgi:hypothetical protein